MANNDKETKIDFLCIGAQKAASSWLYEHLKSHPDFWMTPNKELHYFDRSRKYPSCNRLDRKYFFQRALRLDNDNRTFWINHLKASAISVLKKDAERFFWYQRYFFGTCSDEWYLSLFEGGRGKVTGEVGPSYSILDLEDVQSIKRLLPNLKIIFIMRDPCDRSWSNIRFWVTKGKFKTLPSASEMKEFIDTPRLTLRSDYLRTLNIWSSVFSKEKVFVGFFDDVIKNPKKLLDDIYGFLGAREYPQANLEPAQKQVNVSKRMDIPPEIERYLAEKYLPDLEKLSDMFGGYATEWRDKARRVLA